jgi:hypothetical protein
MESGTDRDKGLAEAYGSVLWVAALATLGVAGWWLGPRLPAWAWWVEWLCWIPVYSMGWIAGCHAVVSIGAVAPWRADTRFRTKPLWWFGKPKSVRTGVVGATVVSAGLAIGAVGGQAMVAPAYGIVGVGLVWILVGLARAASPYG